MRRSNLVLERAYELLRMRRGVGRETMPEGRAAMVVMTWLKKSATVSVAAAMIAGFTVGNVGATKFGPIPDGRQIVGGLDLNAYCRSDGGWGRTALGAVLIDHTAGGWRCKYLDWSWYSDGSLEYDSIDTDSVCRQEYSEPGVESDFVDWNNPYSIVCIVPR